MAMAFLYGFVLLRFFRYFLDHFYPFWSKYISLSLFAYILAFFIWLSFFRYFPKHYFQNLPNTWPRLLFLGNTLILLTLLLILKENFLLYGQPLIYGILLAIQGYFYASLLPKKITNRPFLFGGMALAVLLGDFSQEIYVLLSLGAIFFLFPASWLGQTNLPVLSHRIRLQPLRLSLDFIRFMFLAIALYGIFDKFRSNFYPIAFVLIAGALIQELILRYYKKKEHIRFGLILLGPFFAFVGVLAHYLHFPMVAAFGYFVLSLWEAVYFRRAPEGYLRREHWLSGIVLLLLIFFHFLSENWAFSLTGILIFLSLTFIFAYLYRKYRQSLAALFLLSLLSWLFWEVSQFQSLVVREFWQKKQESQEDSVVVHPLWYFLPNFKKFLVTNFHPNITEERELILTERTIQFVSIPPFFLTSWLFLNTFTYKEKSILLYLPNLSPYTKEIPKNVLTKLTERLLPNRVFYLEDGQIDPPLNNIGQISEDDFYKIIEFFAQIEIKRQNYKIALAYYQIFQKNFPQAHFVYEKIVDLCGQMGDVLCQIKNLEIYLEKNPQKNFFEKKILLVELYFLQGEYLRARQLATKLLQEDRSNGLLYLNWIFKTMEKEKDHFLWQNFYYQVKNFPVETENQKRDKEILLEKIEKAIEANPAFHYLFQKEQKRQEHIYFPD